MNRAFKLRKVHPGRTLALELESRKMDIDAIPFCKVSAERLRDYAAGKILLEDKELHLLSDALGVGYPFLKNLQLNYER